MKESNGERRIVPLQTEAERYNASRLKSEINVQRCHLEAVHDRLDTAASNYAEEIDILIRKLKKVDEGDSTLELHVDAINDTLEKNRNSMRALIANLASLAGLTKANRKRDIEEDGFLFVDRESN
ncbi:uncharacterized protein N7515_001922 [Penicillium bovifimosum]|uniref:Uncharacterized protein n=1 Tax=Penicillium bovifimosum TaxID=126998 RepID=A0A9W9HAM4_9EURO|nr:uncharacterized protein N7515_001922 [Penicillium bovifimosum]KAJ5143135.1 hypothetical protein N7515_001922 [Penicillium bovifimosum]